MEYSDVLNFWFNELSGDDHFVKNEKVDQQIIERFSAVHEAATRGELDLWQETPEGALALIIVLDQFSRNMFRGDKRSFTQDTQALKVAESAIEKGFDKKLPQEKRLFMYMPYMHSESKEVHERALALFEDLGMEGSLKYEHIHKDIIDRFGRYPHRNEVLGRTSTKGEVEYLENNQESFF